MNLRKVLRSIVGLILAVGFACLVAQPMWAAGTVRYVSPMGSDSSACVNPAAPCLMVQYAIGQAVSGDELRLAGGTYDVAASSDKSLMLRGGYAADFGSRDPVVHLTTLNGKGFNTALTPYGQADAFIL